MDKRFRRFIGYFVELGGKGLNSYGLGNILDLGYRRVEDSDLFFIRIVSNSGEVIFLKDIRREGEKKL